MADEKCLQNFDWKAFRERRVEGLKYTLYDDIKIDVVYVDVVRLCLWTAASNGFVYPPYDRPTWEWRATVEWCWQGKMKNSETNLSQYHFANQKSYMDWPVREPGLHCKKPATSPELWHDRNWFCWNSFVGCGLGSSGPGRGPVVGCCEHGTERSGST
jgi:hypothetical protein